MTQETLPEKQISEEQEIVIDKYELPPDLKEMVDKLKKNSFEGDITNAPLFSKIAYVMKSVKRVPKNGWNKFHSYKYPTETDLLEAVREFLAEAGLVLMASVEESERVHLEVPGKVKWFYRIKMSFTLGCATTGQTITTYFHGEGGDNEDKGLYKAYTNTMKYYLRQTFLIPTGDESTVDGQPMDVEYDRSQNNQSGGNKNKNNNRNSGGQKGKQGGSGGGSGTVKYETLQKKWKVIGGNDDNFKEWYDKQIKANVNHTAMNAYIDTKIKEKNEKEAAERKANSNGGGSGQS